MVEVILVVIIYRGYSGGSKWVIVPLVKILFTDRNVFEMKAYFFNVFFFSNLTFISKEKSPFSRKRRFDISLKKGDF